MANNPMLENIAVTIGRVNKDIKQAQEAISIAREAGEDVSPLELSLRELIQKKDRWQKVLENRGINIPEPQ